MDLSEARDVFLAESEELLDSMEKSLLGIEQALRDKASIDPDAVNVVFRAVHTMKGSAGIFGFQPIQDFLHDLEYLLDQIRTDQRRLDNNLVTFLIASRDHVSRLVEEVSRLGPQQEMQLEGALAVEDQNLIARTREFLGREAPAGNQGASSANEPQEEGIWHIHLAFHESVFLHGMDPLSFIRYLDEIGEIQSVKTDVDRVPALHDLNPENCYLTFDIELKGATNEKAIREVFEFVSSDCDISIKELRSLPEPAVPEDMIQDPDLVDGMDNLDAAAEATRRESRYIRVDSSKLDLLVNLVGELVISTAHVAQLAERGDNPELTESANNVTYLVTQIRDNTFGLRMVPIGGVFGRFQRAVFDLGRQLNKDVQLKVQGADTELDKNLVEKLTDPLMHLVRNSVDHGIESTELRKERGKPERGTILLNAYNDTGDIVIEVSDDGGGMDRDQILARAIERGIAKRDSQYSDEEVYDFIFSPGFSTAKEVTSVSGRGVGMDVVRRNIESLRGKVEIQSTPGKGSRIRIRMPLTLAIIDGFLVRAGSTFYVIPLDLVTECADFNTIEAAEGVMNLRGEAMPYIRMAEFFGETRQKNGRENMVIVRHSGRVAGLVVNDLHGEHQSVIKPLGGIMGRIQGVTGSTILGDGTIALVLDIASLLDIIEESDRKSADPVEVGQHG